jgi:hypothetical protein
MNRIYIPARVVLNHEGRYVIKIDPDLSQQYLKEVAGGDVEVHVKVSIQRDDNEKTNPQLRYFYGVVYPIVKLNIEMFEGRTFTKTEIMTILKELFFFEDLPEGKKLGSLAKASKQELVEFIGKVIDFAETTFGVKVPEPQDLNNI